MKIRFFILEVLIFAGALLIFSQKAEAQSKVMKLSLNDCLRIGLANNPQIKMAEAKVESARGKLISARSYLIPQIKASGLYTHANNLPEFKISGMNMIPTSFPVANESGTPLPPTHIHLIPFPDFEMSSTREGDIYSFKIELVYPIFTGGRTTQGYKASKLELEASELELKQKKLEVSYQIQQAFYQVLLAQEMVKAIDQSWEVMQEHYQQVRELYRQGYVSNLDLLQVEAKLSSIKPRQIQAHNGLNLAKLALKNILNLDPGTEIEVIGKLEYVPKEIPELNELIKEALLNNPQLKSLEIRKQQAETLIKISRAGYFPTIALFANYQWNRGQEMPPNEDIWREGWQAGVSASLNLFDGLKTYGDVKSARSQLEQVMWGERALRSGIETQVTASYLKLISAQRAVEAQKVNVEASERNFQVAQARYREGYVNHLDVLDAEMNLTQAKIAYLQAVNDWLISWAELEKVIGKLEVEEK